MLPATYDVDPFLTTTIGFIVFFTGRSLNRRFQWLRNFHIPEPVTGGLIWSLFFFLWYYLFDQTLQFDMTERDELLVYFFTCIGLNARLSDLFAGGKPLLILLCLTLGFIVIQDIVGIATALSLGQPAAMGVLGGSASLIGGHGTAIAWAPKIASDYGITNALEVGTASATLGLIVASLIGGPIAKHLLNRYQLSSDTEERNTVGIAHDRSDTETINHVSIISVLLVLHVAIILGYGLNQLIMQMGLNLPLFVSCLLVGIVLSNTVPVLMPKLYWPARTKAMAVISDFSLGLFLSMSLMSMQLWTLGGIAGTLGMILICQVVVAVLFIRFILFPLMGRNYQASVLSAGFGGFALGATPTAIANMTAVTKAHGAAPTAFLILPLVSAFFVDITNAFVIQFSLEWFSR